MSLALCLRFCSRYSLTVIITSFGDVWVSGPEWAELFFVVFGFEFGVDLGLEFRGEFGVFVEVVIVPAPGWSLSPPLAGSSAFFVFFGFALLASSAAFLSASAFASASA